MRPHDELLLKSIVSPVLVIAGIVAFYVFRATDSADVIRKRPQWFAGNPAKRWTEKLFLYYAVFWISWFGIVVVSGIWEDFQEMSYFVVTFAMAAPCVLLPWYLQPPEEAARPFWQRYWVKANIWIAVISFVGNHFWTHYFYTMLGASYTFKAWRLNDVPIAMHLATHCYFCFYHSLTTIGLRRFWTSWTYQQCPHWLRPLASGAVVLLMAWFTAFSEAFTIQGFPYYYIKDREYLYTIGSVVYGLYFVVSFPMYYRLDEGKLFWGSHPDVPPETAQVKNGSVSETGDGPDVAPLSSRSRRQRMSSPSPSKRSASLSSRVYAAATSTSSASRKVKAGSESAWARGWECWSAATTAIDSLGACMLVTILLDLWRLLYGAIVTNQVPGLPWMLSAYSNAEATPVGVNGL